MNNKVKERFKNYIENSDKYVILDTETTGLASDDQIVEIAIVSTNGDILLDTLVYTDKEIHPRASAVNGIKNKDLEGKPTIIDLKEKLDDIFKDRTVLIYNSAFDLRMLEQSGYKGAVKSACLMADYMEYVESEKRIALTKAMATEGVEIVQDHRATGDCLCCLELIKAIVNK